MLQAPSHSVGRSEIMVCVSTLAVLRHCVRVAKEMDSKYIGLWPQGLASPRCRYEKFSHVCRLATILRGAKHLDTTTCQNQLPFDGCVSPMRSRCQVKVVPGSALGLASGLLRNGDASDSRSEGWEYESLQPHLGIRLTSKR